MRMFTKIGVTVAAGAFPVLLWAGAASAQQSQSQQDSQSQSQSQSQSSISTVVTTPSNLGGVNGGGGSGTLARTGAEDLLPLALGGAAVAGAVAVRGVRRRSVV